ncbi:MAG: hypothetical protein WA151_17435, partial [Desulfatirhabdiaceae bacterium]
IFLDDFDRDNFLNRLGGILSDSQTSCFFLVIHDKSSPPIIEDGYRSHRYGNECKISTKLNIASSTASESVARGRRIVAEHGLKLLEENIT